MTDASSGRLRILGVIDHLGAGGAQRQFAELMAGLARRGHAVEAFIYHPDHDFFAGGLADADVPVHTVDRSEGVVGVARTLRRVLRAGDFDVAVAFLDQPALLIELVGVVSGRTRVVVSERASHHGDPSLLRSMGRRAVHNLADAVVTNNHSHAEWLRDRWYIRTPVRVIYNGISLDDFDPRPNVPEGPTSLRLLGIGRIGPEKNLPALIRALGLAGQELDPVPSVDWVGNDDLGPGGADHRREVDALLARMPEVAERWRWLGRRSDVPALLASHHALVHPALHEGLPNAVCEALASGRPVLASDRCDHPILVEDGVRGFLFDPEDPADIAGAIVRAAHTPPETWERMGHAARAFATARLDAERMLAEFEELFRSLVHGRVGEADTCAV